MIGTSNAKSGQNENIFLYVWPGRTVERDCFKTIYLENIPDLSKSSQKIWFLFPFEAQQEKQKNSFARQHKTSQRMNKKCLLYGHVNHSSGIILRVFFCSFCCFLCRIPFSIPFFLLVKHSSWCKISTIARADEKSQWNQKMPKRGIEMKSKTNWKRVYRAALAVAFSFEILVEWIDFFCVFLNMLRWCTRKQIRRQYDGAQFYHFVSESQLCACFFLFACVVYANNPRKAIAT